MTETSFPLPYASTDLTGQVALVTGASSGSRPSLRHHPRRRRRQRGASPVAASTGSRRSPPRSRRAAARAVPVQLDVTDAAQIVAAVDAAEAAFGTVTILVNNAGIPDAQRAHKMSIELIDQVIDTNLRGPYILACEVAKRLIAAKLPGRIVNISSMGAFRYDGGGAALYSITKAAVNRMTEALSVEWARFGINVNGIAPGAFTSEMMDGMVERIGDFTHTLPRKRMGDPAQLDSTLLYLVAPSSEFVTGTVIKVDDGQAANRPALTHSSHLRRRMRSSGRPVPDRKEPPPCAGSRSSWPASASGRRLSSAPPATPSAQDSGQPAGTGAKHEFVCAHVTEIQKLQADRLTVAGDRLGLLNEAKTTADQNGNTKRPTRSAKRITRVTNEQSKITDRQQKLGAACGTANS